MNKYEQEEFKELESENQRLEKENDNFIICMIIELIIIFMLFILITL